MNVTAKRPFGARSNLGAYYMVEKSVARKVAEKGTVLQFTSIFFSVALFAVSLSGCVSPRKSLPLELAKAAEAPLKSETSVAAVAADSGLQEERLPSSILSEPVPASARILIPESSDMAMEMLDGEGYNQLVIGQNLTESQFKVSRLSSPERLVVDITRDAKLEKTETKSFNTEDSQFVARVRLGSHPDKARVVVDLNGTAEEGAGVKYRSQLVDGKIVLTVSSDPALLGRIAEGGARVAAVNQSDIAEKSVVASAVAVEKKVEPKVVAQQSSITNLSVEQVGSSSNILVADIDGDVKYTLTRTSPSEYLLAFENAKLLPQAAMTLISPPKSGVVRSVRPVTSGENVELRIFASPEAALVARTNGRKLVVSAASLTSSDSDRAQFVPETKSAPDTKTAASAKVEAPKEEAKKEEIKKEEAKKDSGDSEAAAKKESAAEVVQPDADVVTSLLEESPKYTGRLISLDLQDTDIDNALRIIAEVSNLNIIASQDVTGKVTLRLIDVPWDQALDVILKTNGLDKVQEGNVIRIAPVEKLRQERESLKASIQAEDDLEPLSVKYIRVSYSKASELKPLVESVITERGTVTYDDRTNQLIVKDIRKGIKNVAELVAKVDLRTPQVLLETQIVEAQRSLLRDMGSQLGFNFVQSPATGNPTGYNFPNSVTVGGSRPGGVASSFPSNGATGLLGSAVNFLFDSADGTKSLDVALSALETEGRVRIVSRPSVATTNNKQATIKSVEKIRVKTPSGGLSVATGAGSTAAGGSAVATETIEIGITLEVTPQASPDYYVLLDINAKSSTFGTKEVEGIPSEIERSATSVVLVSSGQTFAMGGIYKITDKDALNGVPFFKDIPFLGHFFRRSEITNSDEELIFFLTPRIIEGSFDDATMKVAS